MSLTLHFIEWQCGHHCQRPADIPVSDPAQVTLILQAISHAISQPGQARAALLGMDSAQCAYITDDYVSVGHGSQHEFSTDGQGWICRPQVICCTAEQQAEIHSEALKDAVEALYATIDCWDGKADVQDVQIVTTTLARAEVETLAAPLDAYEERHIPFGLPPVFLDAAAVLEELRAEATYQAEQEGGAA